MNIRFLSWLDLRDRIMCMNHILKIVHNLEQGHPRSKFSKNANVKDFMQGLCSGKGILFLVLIKRTYSLTKY